MFVIRSSSKQYSQVEKILEEHLPSCIPQVTLMQQGLYMYACICNLPSRKFIILDAKWHTTFPSLLHTLGDL
jgi:hypothetical protein